METEFFRMNFVAKRRFIITPGASATREVPGVEDERRWSQRGQSAQLFPRKVGADWPLRDHSFFGFTPGKLALCASFTWGYDNLPPCGHFN